MDDELAPIADRIVQKLKASHMRRKNSSCFTLQDLTHAVHELLEAGVIELGPHLSDE